MKKKKTKTIKIKGPDITPCSIEGCTEIATAFLQATKESAGRKIITKSIGYCVEHAKQKHQQLLEGPFVNYQPDSFEKPHNLNEKK
jgi:hypothetical protein